MRPGAGARTIAVSSGLRARLAEGESRFQASNGHGQQGGIEYFSAHIPTVSSRGAVATGRGARRPANPLLRSAAVPGARLSGRSEEDTSELQSRLRISYDVFCSQKKDKSLTNEVITGPAQSGKSQAAYMT